MPERLPMDCRGLQADLSAYVDGELAPARSAALLRHLEQCRGCAARLTDYHDFSFGLRALPPPPPPPGRLGLRLRVQASHAARGPRWSYWGMRLSGALRALALPTVVGTAAALMLFTMMAGTVGLRPVGPGYGRWVTTRPGLAASGYATGLGAFVVQARINAAGRVDGYRLLSGPADAAQLRRLNDELRLSVFRPATTDSGQPTAGSVVLSFGTVNVRG